MLTVLWGAESADDTSDSSRAAAGVEERAGTRGMAKNGISFLRAGVRKLDSFSEHLPRQTTGEEELVVSQDSSKPVAEQRSRCILQSNSVIFLHESRTLAFKVNARRSPTAVQVVQQRHLSPDTT